MHCSPGSSMVTMLLFTRLCLPATLPTLPSVLGAPTRGVQSMRSMYFLVFCRLYLSFPLPPWQCLAPTCHLSTLNKHCIAGARFQCLCLFIWLERFRGSQKEDECGPLIIQSSLGTSISQWAQQLHLMIWGPLLNRVPLKRRKSEQTGVGGVVVVKT